MIDLALSRRKVTTSRLRRSRETSYKLPNHAETSTVDVLTAVKMDRFALSATQTGSCEIPTNAIVIAPLSKNTTTRCSINVHLALYKREDWKAL